VTWGHGELEFAVEIMSLVGSRVGVYEVVAPLGAGGMGEVYRARDTRLGRDVAIKILPSAVATDPERLARFEREARVLASVNHPNIGAIYGLEESAGVTALVLELVEGETLADRLARAPLRPGAPPPRSSWIEIDEPTTTGRPCGWSLDSRVAYLLLDIDGFRCLWGQKVDATSGRPIGTPCAVRHFHRPQEEQFSTSFGNPFTAQGFLYGARRLQANIWRLQPAAPH
jgi:protein kinase-like protein